MTNYREILRLYHQGFSSRQISQSIPCSRTVVIRVLKRFKQSEIQWPLPDNITNIQIEEQLYRDTKSKYNQIAPDFEHIHKELSKNGVTLTLLWTEYSDMCRQNKAIPYKYSQFCKLYGDFANTTKATMRLRHKPGEKLEVDWAGQTAVIKDKITGEPIKAYIFVATLPYSGYSYVEAFLNMNMENWIHAHINCIKFFGGITKILVPDNLKTGVDKANWYSPIINRTYGEMASWYDSVVIPARVRRPKDKPSVENTVGIISTWIIASLRNITFFSLYDLNLAIREKLDEFNSNPFQKKEGSRKSIFLQEEQSELLVLPPYHYELSIWNKAIVQFNYHIIADKMYYSVPYEYIKHQVDIKLTSSVVEVFFSGNRIASHIRKYGNPGQYQTVLEHMPESHQKSLGWNSDRFIKWASEIGENTLAVVKFILTSHKVEQQGYKSCMALLKSADKYSLLRLEKACERALYYTPRPSYKIVQTILQNGSDKVTITEKHNNSSDESKYGLTRGSEYYRRNKND